MAKKYELPNDDAQKVCETAVAYSYGNMQETDSVTEWGRSDAPGLYSVEELQFTILQSLEDEKNGRIHSHADVQQMINSRIEAWR